MEGAFGDLSHMEDDREAFRKRFAEAYPQTSERSAVSAGMLYRFRFEMRIGDYVVFPSKSNSAINIGMVDGEYHYEAAALRKPGEYINQRKIKWLKHLPRTAFSKDALRESTASMSLFIIKNHVDEFLAALDTGNTGPQETPRL